MKNLKSVLWLLLLCCLLSSMGALQGATIDAGEITRTASKPVIPIAIVSNNPKLDAIAARAFSIHGAYTVVSEAQAAFIFRFNRVPSETSALQLVIESPARQKLFEQQVSCSNSLEALYRACDLAVLKTTGLPGFFAGKITYVGGKPLQRELFASDLLFQQVVQLTHDASDALLPHWSPDGKTILYTTYFKSGFPDLYKLELLTRRRTLFAGYAGINVGAAFNPGGTTVAMVLSGCGAAEVYLSGPSGLKPKRLTHNKSLKSGPSWSPDGQRLIVASDEMGAPQLYEVALTTGLLSRLPTALSKYCAEPHWNPRNPNLIAFTASQAGHFQLALFDFSTRSSCFLTTNTSADSLGPCWTNDGQHLIFTRHAGKQNQLFLLDTETGKESPLHSVQFGSFAQPNFVYPP